MANPTNTQFAVGVHVLTLLADASSAPLSSAEMAASADANPVYVRRVLGRLREAELVSSRPGVKGGWVLMREPARITLGDVWRAIQGEDPILGLHQASPRCEAGQQIQRTLAAVDRRAARAIESELDGMTVRDVLPPQPGEGARAPARPGRVSA